TWVKGGYPSPSAREGTFAPHTKVFIVNASLNIFSAGSGLPREPVDRKLLPARRGCPVERAE
ncbi:MAG: hypothetical protein DSO01_05670, partial [Archaeoglobi archaeon]